MGKTQKKAVRLALLFISFTAISCVPGNGQNPGSGVQQPIRETILGYLNDGSVNSQNKYARQADRAVEIEAKNGQDVDNLSAIIFVPTTKTYFGLRNNDNYIHEMDQNFNVIRDIKIKSFGGSNDLEGMAYLGEGADGPEVAMVNEDAELFIGTIPSKATSIERSRFKKIILAHGDFGNEGPEGLCYNRQERRFYVAFEGEGDSQTTRLITFLRPDVVSDGMDISKLTVEPFDIYQATKAGDIADIALDPTTGHLLALSEVTREVYELGLDGTLYGHHILNQQEQFEGLIVREDTKELVIAAEPNVINSYNYKD